MWQSLISSIINICCDPRLKRIDNALQMRGHTMHFMLMPIINYIVHPLTEKSAGT